MDASNILAALAAADVAAWSSVARSWHDAIEMLQESLLPSQIKLLQPYLRRLEGAAATGCNRATVVHLVAAHPVPDSSAEQAEQAAAALLVRRLIQCRVLTGGVHVRIGTQHRHTYMQQHSKTESNIFAAGGGSSHAVAGWCCWTARHEGCQQEGCGNCAPGTTP